MCAKALQVCDPHGNWLFKAMTVLIHGHWRHINRIIYIPPFDAHAGAKKRNNLCQTVYLLGFRPSPVGYFRCALSSLVISNMLTLGLPKMGLSLVSALIMRLFAGSCRPCILMCSQGFLMTSGRSKLAIRRRWAWARCCVGGWVTSLSAYR